MTAKKDRKDWMKKGPAPKYNGGSIAKTFRLPSDPKEFAEAVAGIEKVLLKYTIKKEKK